MAGAFLGTIVGTVLGYPVCGIIAFHLDWRAVFYITGKCMLWPEKKVVRTFKNGKGGGRIDSITYKKSIIFKMIIWENAVEMNRRLNGNSQHLNGNV